MPFAIESWVKWAKGSDHRMWWKGDGCWLWQECFHGWWRQGLGHCERMRHQETKRARALKGSWGLGRQPKGAAGLGSASLKACELWQDRWVPYLWSFKLGTFKDVHVCLHVCSRLAHTVTCVHPLQMVVLLCTSLYITVFLCLFFMYYLCENIVNLLQYSIISWSHYW